MAKQIQANTVVAATENAMKMPAIGKELLFKPRGQLTAILSQTMIRSWNSGCKEPRLKGNHKQYCRLPLFNIAQWQ